MMLNPAASSVGIGPASLMREWPKPLPASIIPAVKYILIRCFMLTSKEIEIFKESRTRIKALRTILTKSPIIWLHLGHDY